MGDGLFFGFYKVYGGIVLDKVKEIPLHIGPFFGGFQIIPYQMAFGISAQYLKCYGGRLLRLYFGPFKLWLDLKRFKEE